MFDYVEYILIQANMTRGNLINVTAMRRFKKKERRKKEPFCFYFILVLRLSFRWQRIGRKREFVVSEKRVEFEFARLRKKQNYNYVMFSLLSRKLTAK
jgi:hypothetical protein